MPAQTESLIKLISATSSGRGTATTKISNFRYQRTTDSWDYKMRPNQINVTNEISTNGATMRIQLPAFSSAVGEQWLQIDLPQLSGDAKYDPHVGAKLIKNLRLIHSDIAWECEPERVWPILLSCCRDDKLKEKRKAIFGNATASANAQSICVPLLQPWSVHFSDEMYRSDGVRQGRRTRGLFPAFGLKENCVWEIEFQPRSHYTSDASTDSAAGPSNIALGWEEVVASSETLNKIKKSLPLQVCCPDFTFLKNQTNAGVEKEYNITSVTSRAPTNNLWLLVKANSDVSRDPFNLVAEIDTEELECDGRIVLTNKDESRAVRRYIDMIEGRPKSQDTSPQCPVITLGNDAGYSVAHSRQQLSNTACNSVTLRVKCDAASTFDICAEHQMHYEVSGGTIRSQNVY